MGVSDARPLPLRGQPLRVTFPLFDADGDLVGGAAGLDSEVSLDGAAFVGCTHEAVELAPGSGMYYLDLTAAETDAATVAVVVKSSTAGAKATPLVFYPAATNGSGWPVTAQTVADKTGYALAAVYDAAKSAASADDVPTAAEIDAQLSTAHGSGRWGAAPSAGANASTLTIDDGTAPLDGVAVWLTTDAGGANVVASGSTDALGHVTFLLDAGPYYVWCQRAGYNFVNPSLLVVGG